MNIAKKQTVIAATLAVALTATTALAEGTVTVYTAVPQNFIDELVPMFEEGSGTKVEIIKAGSGELLNRLTAEASGPVADVLWSVDGTVIDFNPALFTAYTPKGADALAPGMRQSDLWSPFTAVVMAFIVNEGKLDGKPVPTSWESLGDPMYDDMISSARADGSGSAYIQYATVLQAFGSEEAGMDVYKKILGNYVLSDSSGAVPRFVNDGELAIGVTLEDAALRYKEGGGPVTIIYPSEGTPVTPDAMAMVAGAPNEAAGQAFIDFMLSAEAQTVVAELGRRPVRADVASNELLVPMADLPALTYDAKWAADNRERLVDAWKDAVLDVQ